ncbi:MAG: hypothetical protein ACK5PP_05425 [Acidimicrobiales bacterium]
MADGDPTPARPGKRKRRAVLVRLDPGVHDAVTRWAEDDLRSVNAQVEVLLRDALRRSGRLPRNVAPIPKRGRPRADRPDPADPTTHPDGGPAPDPDVLGAGPGNPAPGPEDPTDPDR